MRATVRVEPQVADFDDVPHARARAAEGRERDHRAPGFLKQVIFEPGPIPALDGVRACAAIWVVLHHAYKTVIVHERELPSPLADVLCSGDMAVDAHFTLSGFLIMQLLWKELERSGRINLGAFFLRRWLRIGPTLSSSDLHHKGTTKLSNGCRLHFWSLQT